MRPVPMPVDFHLCRLRELRKWWGEFVAMLLEYRLAPLDLA